MGHTSDSHDPDNQLRRSRLFPGSERGTLIRLWEFLAAVTAVIVGVILVILLWRLIEGDDIDHNDLDERLTVLEQEARFQSCVLLILPTERGPDSIADCVLTPNLPE